jgi:hypothetical protein
MSNALFSNTTSKRIATLMAVMLFYETVAMPITQAAMIAPPAPAGSSLSLLNSQNARIAPAGLKEKFTLPVAVGSLAESYAPVSAGRLVYHFQDVHNDVAAQTNLAEMVSLLEMHARQQGKNLVVAVEGVTGAEDSDSIARVPNQKNKEDIGAALLRGGYMMGEEYAAITNEPGRIKLVGIEQPDLYQRNLTARSSSRAARKNVLVAIKEIRSQLETLKRHNFSTLLSTLEDKRLAVDAGTFSLTDYASFLANASPSVVASYPQLAQLAKLNALEQNIDFSAVEKESQSLVAELTASQTDSQVEKLMQDAESLKAGQLSAIAYYSGLLRQTRKSYPTLERYVAYLRASDGIDADRLFDEVMQAEERIAHSLVRHPIAQKLYDHLRWIEQEEKFFALNIIPQEWAREQGTTADSVASRLADIHSFIQEQEMDLGYRFNEPVIAPSDLTKAVAGARGFYTAACDRNAALFANLQRVLKENPADRSIVAFITGGFHTPEMTKALRANGLAYAVFRPQLETDVELSQDIKVPARKVNYTRGKNLIAEIGPKPIADAAENLEENLPELEKKLGDVTPIEGGVEGGTEPGNQGTGGKIKELLDDMTDPGKANDITRVFALLLRLGGVLIVAAAKPIWNGAKSLFGSGADAALSSDHVGPQLDASVGEAARYNMALRDGLKRVLFGTRQTQAGYVARHARSDVDKPATLIVPVDEFFGGDSNDDSQVERMISTVVEFNAKAEAVSGVKANIVFNSESENTESLNRVQAAVKKNASHLSGFNFAYTTHANALDRAGVVKQAKFTYDESKTYVFTKAAGAETWQVSVAGVPNLVLAVMAYAYYDDGKSVLDELLPLVKWSADAYFSSELARELVAAIQA